MRYIIEVEPTRYGYRLEVGDEEKGKIQNNPWPWGLSNWLESNAHYYRKELERNKWWRLDRETWSVLNAC